MMWDRTFVSESSKNFNGCLGKGHTSGLFVFVPKFEMLLNTVEIKTNVIL